MKKPNLAIRAKDLKGVVYFYTGLLGFTLNNLFQEADIAECADFEGDRILIIGPSANDPTPYLEKRYGILEPGETILFSDKDLDLRCIELTKRGLVNLQVKKEKWGDQLLAVKDPNGYTLKFVDKAQLSQEEVLTFYTKGPEELEIALRGLSEQDIDLASPSSGGWSIRMIVHHIFDGDSIWTTGIKAALANSGSVYSHDWYGSDNALAKTLNYCQRSIDKTLPLFQANRAYVQQMVQDIAGAWERFILFRRYYATETSRTSVGDIIRARAVHALQHIEEIQEIRQLHNV